LAQDEPSLMDNEKTKLNDFILDHYSLGEIKNDLCFCLGVDSDDLEGGTRVDKARGLVEYLARRRRLGDLHVLLKQQRAELYAVAFPAAPVIEIPPAPPFPSTPALPDRRIHEKTGIELIRIPAGPFLYGVGKQTIELPEYYIGRYPVTNAQYKRFVDANPRQQVPFVDKDLAKLYNWDETRRTFPVDKIAHPVVLVSWHDAAAFCEWAGLTLPTEEQWEKAARGMDGRIWPWGDEEPGSEHCNFNDNVDQTTPIGLYSPKGDSPFGCADMAGNVREWTDSWYLRGKTRVLRGGAWDKGPLNTSTFYRSYYGPQYRPINVGFRVVELLSDPDS